VVGHQTNSKQSNTMKARFARVEALVVNHVAQMKANAFVSSKAKK
jgi:hypothetical protein